jgi:hypothetical protein
MSFTINPAEAQALQEDQAQLLGALAQATRGLLVALEPAHSPATASSETLRIQMGRRLVYGQLANGQFRNELAGDRLKTIFEALQRPATEGVDPKKYQGRIPAIEIREGSHLLFREESDGVVTVNQIQFQLQQDQTESRPLPKETTPVLSSSETEASALPLEKPPDLSEHSQRVRQAQELRVLSLAVLDLQGRASPSGDRQYESDQFVLTQNATNGTLTVTASDQIALQTSRDGQILVATPALISSALIEIGDAYQQAEALQWQRESQEAPPDALNGQVQTIRAQAIADTAQFLLNPLGYEQPLYGAVSINGYHIFQDQDGLMITRGPEDLVLIVREGQVWDYSSTREDWEAFQKFQIQPLGLGHSRDLLQSPADVDPEPSRDRDEQLEKMGSTELLAIAREVGLYPNHEYPEVEPGILDPQQIISDILHIQSTPTDFAADRNERPLQPPVDTPADPTSPRLHSEAALNAIAVAQREAAKLPEGPTQQLIQATHQDWKQQIFQGVGQGLREGMSWLAARSEAMRTQRMARASLALFQRGYVRTGEKAYEVQDFKIALQGMNVYSLSDSAGELLRFKALEGKLPGLNRSGIQILYQSDRLSSAHQSVFQQMQADKSVMPMGELDVEASYGAKTQRVEQTVRLFLKHQNASAWDKAGGRFQFETGPGHFLKIVDKKEGRGEVYRRENGRVISSLGTTDFIHFEKLASKLQSIEFQPAHSAVPQVQSGSQQKQASGVEMG